jgi:hypothetical protein
MVAMPAVDLELSEDSDGMMRPKLQVASLQLAPYQRPPGAKDSEYIATHFNPHACQALSVSHRDGIYWLVDGQRRRDALVILKIAAWDCYLYTGMTYEQEASLFSVLNSSRPVTQAQRFKADLEAGEPTAVDVRRIVQARGMALFGNARARHPIKCVVPLRRIYTFHGEAGMEWILDTLLEAWPDHRVAPLRGEFVSGLEQFYARYKDVAERKRVVDRLKAFTPGQILAAVGSQLTNSMDVRIGKYVRELYVSNADGKESARYLLPEWPQRSRR